MTYSFKNDYSEGCHPRILELLSALQDQQQNGYGEDLYSQQAKVLIRKKIKDDGAEIHFISGGTQANLTVIASALRPHESVIAAETAHIHVHEAGSIEATGHKINTIISEDGKLHVEAIQNILDEHTNIPHMVVPKMVYLSNATEVGTLYSKKELQNLYEFCQSHELFLFMDGARLGAALCAYENDLTWEDIARFTDVFYIGGTKNGALLGEAIVITNPTLKNILGFHLKQRGALLAKGSVLGIQFLGLFEEDRYITLATHAYKMSKILAEAIEKKGFPFLFPPVTNQIFPILPNNLIDYLSKDYGFYIWKKMDSQHAAIRLVTSWNTPEKVVKEFADSLKNYSL